MSFQTSPGNRLNLPLQNVLQGLAGLLWLAYTSCQQVRSRLETLQTLPAMRLGGVDTF